MPQCLGAGFAIAGAANNAAQLCDPSHGLAKWRRGGGGSGCDECGNTRLAIRLRPEWPRKRHLRHLPREHRGIQDAPSNHRIDGEHPAQPLERFELSLFDAANGRFRRPFAPLPRRPNAPRTTPAVPCACSGRPPARWSTAPSRTAHTLGVRAHPTRPYAPQGHRRRPTGRTMERALQRQRARHGPPALPCAPLALACRQAVEFSYGRDRRSRRASRTAGLRGLTLRDPSLRARGAHRPRGACVTREFVDIAFAIGHAAHASPADAALRRRLPGVHAVNPLVAFSSWMARGRRLRAAEACRLTRPQAQA